MTESRHPRVPALLQLEAWGLQLILRQNAAETRVLDGLVRVAELCTVVARKNGLAIIVAAHATFVIGFGTTGSALGARRLHDVGHG